MSDSGVNSTDLPATEKQVLRARSRATGDHFPRFVVDRGIDMDPASWSAGNRAEIDRRVRARTAESRSRSARLVADRRATSPSAVGISATGRGLDNRSGTDQGYE